MLGKVTCIIVKNTHKKTTFLDVKTIKKYI